MLNAAVDYKKEYLDWLNANIDQHEIAANTYRITLPFLDRHNDMIDIYIQKQGSSFIITDDGNTISDLSFSGFDVFSSTKREQLLEQLLRSFSVDLGENDSLCITATKNDLPLKKHLLVQCIQKVDDMFYLAKSNVKSLFLEDVQTYLDDHDIRYVANISFVGKSKLPTMYDFVIPHSKQAPERNIKVVNSLSKNSARGIIFGWNDIRELRKPDSQLYVFLRDDEKKPDKDATAALQEYNITPVPWTGRSKIINKLIA